MLGQAIYRTNLQLVIEAAFRAAVGAAAIVKERSIRTDTPISIRQSAS